MTCCGATRADDGKVGGDGIWSHVASGCAVDLDGRAGRISDVGMKHGHGCAVTGFDRRPFETLAGGEFCQMVAGDGDAPKVTAIDVVLVGGKQDSAAIGGERDVFDFEFAVGVQRRGCVVVRGDGVEVHPAGFLPGKDDAIAGAPEQLVVGFHAVERAAGAWGGAPELVAIS